MKISSDRIEWRSLAATTVIPVPPSALRRGPRALRRRSACLAGRYPFDLTNRRLLLLRRLGAIAIIPPDRAPEEYSHPIPALLLDGNARLRRSAATDRPLRFGTAEGHDYYQIASGRLVACWSSTDEVPAESDAVVVDPNTVRRRGRPPRSGAGHFRADIVVGAILGIMALGVQLLPAREAPDPMLPQPRTDATSRTRWDPTRELLALAVKVQDLELAAFSVTRDGYRWTASTSTPHAEMASLLRDLTHELLTVHIVNGKTILTVEGRR